MSEYDYDLFVIGAGSGGVRASRISASYGKKVAVAEEYRVGGTCVIRGCVPKKMLVYGSEFAKSLNDAKNFGWDIQSNGFSWQHLRDFVLADVDRLNGLYKQTLASNNVSLYEDRAEITGPHSVRLKASGKEISARYILIATGAWPFNPVFAGSELAITSNEIFHLEQLPKRIVIAGGGYIANEFAAILNGLGSEVTLVNRSDVILRAYDHDLRARWIELARAKGIDVRLEAPFEKIVKNGDNSLSVHLGNGHQPIDCDIVLNATGRVPNSQGLGLENAGVDTDKAGAILVDDYNQTSCESIYAVGDVTNRVQLTPVAIREGQAFADSLFNDKPTIVSYENIPSAVFTQPPIGSVGLTEEQAQAKYDEIKVYKSDFRPMKNIFSDRAERGLYKMICEAKTNKVIGLHMIGPESAEILQGAAVAIKAGLTKDDFDATIAIHPSMAEELVLLK